MIYTWPCGSTMYGPTERICSLLYFSDMFGIGAENHSLTKSDLATVHEFQRHNDLNDKTIKHVEASN